jgi:hypothetical protein
MTTCMVMRLADTRSMCSVHVFCACVLECDHVYGPEAGRH